MNAAHYLRVACAKRWALGVAFAFIVSSVGIQLLLSIALQNIQYGESVTLKCSHCGYAIEENDGRLSIWHLFHIKKQSVLAVGNSQCGHVLELYAAGHSDGPVPRILMFMLDTSWLLAGFTFMWLMWLAWTVAREIQIGK